MKVFYKIIEFIGVWIVTMPIVFVIFIPSSIVGALFTAVKESFISGGEFIKGIIKGVK